MNAFDLDSLPNEAMIPRLKTAGITDVILYTRLVTLAAARLLSAAGINLVLVAEWSKGADRAHYTAANGTADAELALRESEVLGIKPPGIYLCNGDFDATDTQIAADVTPYRRAAKIVFDAAGIGAGGYGNGASMKVGLDDGSITKAFVWAGNKTNGTQAFKASGRASIIQEPTVRAFGTAVDPDEVFGDHWGFRVPVPGVTPSLSVDGTVLPVWYTRPLYIGMTGHDVGVVQGILDITADGIFGPNTRATVERFQSTDGLVVDGVVGPKTAAALAEKENAF